MSKQPQQIIAAARGKVDGEILAAAFAKPRGAAVAASGGGLIVGEIGSRWAGKQQKGADAAGIELANPGAVAVTPTSLLTMAIVMSFGGGQVKDVTEVLSTVPLADVDSIEVKRLGMTGVMEITAGGSSFKLEGKVNDMREVTAAFELAKGGN